MPEKLKLDYPVFVALLLALAVAAVYLPVASFDFTNYDDTYYVTRNPHVLRGLTWEGVSWAFTRGYSGNWHPVTWMSHMLDCQLYGLNPAGHHLTSLLLHAANSVLVFLVLRYLTGAAWRSACVAALFALHPLHVESVAWVAERKDLLSAFFGLLCLWAYAAYAKKSEVGKQESEVSGQGQRGRSLDQTSSIQYPVSLSPNLARGGHAASCIPQSALWYVLALLFFALGLMSKPMLVTWPCVLLLMDFWPLRRFGLSTINSQFSTASGPRVAWRLVREKIPFFALSAVSSVVTFLVQRAWGAVVPLEYMPLDVRLPNVPVSYLRYVGKLVWPTDLAVIYPYVWGWPALVILGALLVLGGATLLVLWQHTRRPYLLTGWAWFLGTLVPVIGLIQVGNQAIADRYTYLPSVGLFIMAVWGAAELIGAKPARRLIGGVAATMTLTACALVAQAQTSCWQNTETLFRHALAVTSRNVVAHNSLGFYYAAQSKPEEAKDAFRAALAIQPSCQYSWQGLGMALIEQRKYAEAIAACQAALEADPHMAAAHSTLGLALMKLGQTNDAMGHYAEALRLQPELAEAQYNLANALASQGQIEAARTHYEASLRSDPSSADAHNNLAYMLVREGKPDLAESEFRSALALRPALWQAHYGLAAVLVRHGQVQEAIQQYYATLALRPDFVEALTRLAWLLAVHPDPRVRNGTQAVELAERACRLTQFGQPTVLMTLAAAYAETDRFAEAVNAAQKAQRVAQAAGQTELAHKNQQLLELLQTGQPYREAINP
ncbi:MAG: tetratricopeptide repeat protein [Limisphaerales bacterium]